MDAVKSGIIVDELSRVWVQRYPRPGIDATVLDVFADNGALIANVRSPRKIEVFNTRGGHLIGKWEDSFGVEHVVVYGLPKIQ